MFGSGSTIAPSVPVISKKPDRGSADWNEKVACAEAPPSNSSSSAECVGTVTSKVVPARGPDSTVRSGRAIEPTAATRTTEPNTLTSVVR